MRYSRKMRASMRARAARVKARSASKDLHTYRIHTPVRSEILSPEEYLKVAKSDSNTIKRSRFIPPRIGDRTFGKVEVTYKHPRLRRVE